MELTVLINEAPYANDKAWNALRLAQTALASGNQVKVFLMGDAVYLARRNQQPRAGQPNLEKLLAELLEKGVRVCVCTTCVNSRTYEPTGEYSSCFVGSKSGDRLAPHYLIPGVHMCKMTDLLDWTLNTKVVSF